MALLTQQQKAALIIELAKPQYAGTSAEAAAALMNTPQPGGVSDVTRYPTIATLSAVCLKFGLTGRCEVALLDSATPAEVRVLASNTLTLLRDDYRLQSADVLDPDFIAGLDAFVGLGWLSEAQKAVILSLQTTEAVAGPVGPTPFQVLNLGPIATPNGIITGTCTPEMVTEARS